ncbi:PREDICTED: uncharacterized protein LOC108661579 [Theobroma cacao]|uniref:Uncharacterized protein LOC108661579 n=1 Tax=Theobroma cacao TaxID=3641 RepID=A0AB32WA55_THECC|nr:PREDICTED: uncharacterized protein LOC108661579 [Theobroma cacao]
MLALKDGIRVKKSCKALYEVGCKDKACKFNVRATKLPEGGEYWQVRMFHKVHTCTVDGLQWQFATVSVKIIGELMSHKLQVNGAALRPNDIIVATNEIEIFKYYFWAYGACIRVFRDVMHPTVAIDATHLKSRFKGVLFVAVCKDANEFVYPVAFGISHVKDEDSWMWFLSKLRETVGCLETTMFISNQHLGIKKAIQNAYPEAHHDLCGKCKHEAIEFCANYYKTTVLVEGYAGSIHSVGHPSEWDIPPHVKQIVVLPPPWQGQAERPRRRKIPSAGEGSRARRCSQYKRYGHNRQNCPSPFAVPSINPTPFPSQSTPPQVRRSKACSSCRQTSHTQQLSNTKDNV